MAGAPLGSAEFVRQMEKKEGRRLRIRDRGRPKKPKCQKRDSGRSVGSFLRLKINASVPFSPTAASTGASIAYKSGPGIVAGIVGGQVAFTGKAAEAFGEDALLSFGKSIPIVGVAVSTGALLYDGYQTYKAYSGCLAGVRE